MNLAELITQARNGDKTAITTLYDAYKTPVYYLCLKLTQNTRSAEEMLQRSFLHAFHKLTLLREPNDFPKWIMAVASNRCKNLLKEQNPDLFDADLPETEVRSEFALPEAAKLSATAEDETARNAISSAVDALPVNQRFAVMMCFFGDMSETQASRILECSENLTRTYLDQAMKSLRATADSKKSNPAIATFLPEQLYLILARDSEYARVPGHIAEEVIKNAPVLITNPKATDMDTSGTHYRNKVQKNNILVPVIVLILGIAVIVAGFAVAGKIRASVETPTTTAAKITTANTEETSDTAETTVVEDTTTAGEETTADPSADTSAQGDDTTAPVDDTTAVADTTSTPDTQPITEDPTPVSSFKCKISGNKATITGYIGTETEIIVPSSVEGKTVTEIGAKAFSGTSIVSITLPNTVTTIGIQAFKDCKSLTEVNLPSSLVEIKAYAFRGCSKLAAITLPSSVKKVGATCFGDTAWFTTQPAGFLQLGNGLLIKYNGSDANVAIPSGVTYITNAFYYNKYVKNVTIPDTVYGIGQFAFCSCANLESITIPANVTEIDPQAIYDCPKNLKIIVKKGSYADTWCQSYGFADQIQYN